ncbi:alpha-L-arabinofuranosidase B [Xylariaceae sp. FL0804]|nr:alpha-L-arabinofuranosidase B [Xylariaceae sp. FL0804]
MFSRYLGLGLIAGVAATGPCDIYAQGGTACVAAHSTTRALYAAYDGPLYQLHRDSDETLTDVYPVSAGGVANAATQNSFCSGTYCVVFTVRKRIGAPDNAPPFNIYDQSGNANHLTNAPPGGAATGGSTGGYDLHANAAAAPVTLGGKAAYGVYIDAGEGYRIDYTTGVPTGDAAQTIYAIFDGTHYNDQCCFDYGNAETSNDDTGAGHMQAIYFGSCSFWGSGAGSGPWVMADLENGLFSGQSAKQNTADPTITDRFVTAMVKGESNNWAILEGNAQSGSLTTAFSGARPSGYNPMHQEGSIILGIGGDNSDSAVGTFYEGAIVAGFTSSTVDAAVQANIVAAAYNT